MGRGAVLYPFLALDWPDFDQVGAPAWRALIWLGAVVSIGAYGFYNLGISKVSAQIAAVSINLIPLFTVVMAAVILGERLSPLEWAGGALILIGIVIAALPNKIASNPKAPGQSPSK